jgi:hypothetical protein
MHHQDIVGFVVSGSYGSKLQIKMVHHGFNDDGIFQRVMTMVLLKR